jgi:mannose-6-phosphate isomerase-like protein (cupin superfamily)
MIKLLETALIITSGVLLSNVSVGQNLNIATHVPKSEILAALSGITNLPDQQARVIDIGNGTNIAIGILQRGAVETVENEPITALAHHNVTEVYYVISGSGVLITGGEIETERQIPEATEIVRELVGPTAFRTVTKSDKMNISNGDLVVIPAGVAHGFSKILDQITYLSIRIDPEQVLPAGYKHPLIEN